MNAADDQRLAFAGRSSSRRKGCLPDASSKARSLSQLGCPIHHTFHNHQTQPSFFLHRRACSGWFCLRFHQASESLGYAASNQVHRGTPQQLRHAETMTKAQDMRPRPKMHRLLSQSTRTRSHHWRRGPQLKAPIFRKAHLPLYLLMRVMETASRSGNN
jgi:hypothetical protein